MYPLSEKRYGLVRSYKDVKAYAFRNGFKNGEFMPSFDQAMKMSGFSISKIQKSEEINLTPDIARKVWARLMKDLDQSFFPARFPKTEEGLCSAFFVSSN